MLVFARLKRQKGINLLQKKETLKYTDMDIVDILIEDSAKIMNLEIADRQKLQTAASEVKRKEKLTFSDFRRFAEFGFPLITILANITKKPSQTVINNIYSGLFSYSDFCCAISVFAQDIKLRTQK